MKIEAKAYQDHEVINHREPILGVTMHTERCGVYRVRVWIDRSFFTSQQKYTTFDAADRAAKRIKQKLEPRDA